MLHVRYVGITRGRMFSLTTKAQQSVKGGPETEAFKSRWIVAKRSTVVLRRYRYFTHYELHAFLFPLRES